MQSFQIMPDLEDSRVLCCMYWAPAHAGIFKLRLQGTRHCLQAWVHHSRSCFAPACRA